jgi:hypothetical protein
MIEGNWSSTVEDQKKRERRCGQGKFVAGVVRRPDKAIVPMHLPEGHGKINENCECGNASEKSRQEKQPSQKFSEGRNIAQPCRQAETAYEMNMIVQMMKSILIAVNEHDDAQSQPGYSKGQWLQTV